VTARVETNLVEDRIPTKNVIAETPAVIPTEWWSSAPTLDSVPAGPGINDNGSGSGTILEIAEVYAAQNREPRNKLRFIWFGAEELGLLGSAHYIESLSEAAKQDIIGMLNFDMLGSPNFVRFVYDGDGSAGLVGGAGPPGSDYIEQVFLEYFAAVGLVTDPTAFDGRSDYGPFIAEGIPAGGLFSRAEAPRPRPKSTGTAACLTRSWTPATTPPATPSRAPATAPAPRRRAWGWCRLTSCRTPRPTRCSPCPRPSRCSKLLRGRPAPGSRGRSLSWRRSRSTGECLRSPAQEAPTCVRAASSPGRRNCHAFQGPETPSISSPSQWSHSTRRLAAGTVCWLHAPTVEVAAAPPGVRLRPEPPPLKLHEASDSCAVGADVRLDAGGRLCDGGQVDAEQLCAPLQRRRDRPAQIRVVPSPHHGSVTNTCSKVHSTVGLEVVTEGRSQGQHPGSSWRM
jgi:hypothetical protein